MGTRYHGKNALIYVSGTELVGANAWAVNVTQDSVEQPQFNDSWKHRTVGLADWGGSIQAWDQADEKVLFSAASAGVAVALLIYPTRNTLANYFSGNAIFGMSADGGMAAGVARNGDFVGTDALALEGFT